MPRPLFVAALLLFGLAAPASAQQPVPCEWKFEFHALTDGEVTCTCGPPGNSVLGLGELLEELEVERPQYQGTLAQTLGTAFGTWTYSANSNLCKAAIHAGVIESLETGGIVTARAAPGCQSYLGTEQNDFLTGERGPYGQSFHFPALTAGGCPGEAGYGNRYQGAPALEVLRGLAELAAPRGALRIGEATSLGIEAFEAKQIFIKPSEGQPIVIGRLAVQQIDMENVSRRLPPRYLALTLEDLSLPTGQFGAPLSLLFGGRRVKLDLELDLFFNMERGELFLRQGLLDLEGQGRLRLRGRLAGVFGQRLFEQGVGAAELRWVRAWLDDRTLLAELLPLALGLATAEAEAALDGPVAAELAALAATAPPRTRALALQFAGWLRDRRAPSGQVQAFLQPAEPLALAEIERLLTENPLEAAERLRAALLYEGGGIAAATGDGPRALPAKTSFAEAEELAFDFSGLPGNALDWLAFDYVGTPYTGYRDYRYLEGEESGRVTMGGVRSGFYELRLFLAGPASNGPVDITWFAVR